MNRFTSCWDIRTETVWRKLLAVGRKQLKLHKFALRLFEPLPTFSQFGNMKDPIMMFVIKQENFSLGIKVWEEKYDVSRMFTHRNAVAPQRLLRILQFQVVHSSCPRQTYFFGNVIIYTTQIWQYMYYIFTNPKIYDLIFISFFTNQKA